MDRRAPKASSAKVRATMQANKAKDTRPERILKSALMKSKVAGYKLNPKGIVGRPDIAFPRQKVAVFVHGCFWHHCKKCYPNLPKTHTEFWRGKFLRNRQRDKIKRRVLEKDGWKVFEFWEHEIKQNPYKPVFRN